MNLQYKSNILSSIYQDLVTGEEVDFLKHSALDQQVTSIPC